MSFNTFPTPHINVSSFFTSPILVADFPKELFKELWKTIQSKKIFKGIIKNKAKNGEIYYVNNNFNKVNSIFHSYLNSDRNFMTVNMKNHQTSIGDSLHYNSHAHEYLGNQMFDYFEILK